MFPGNLKIFGRNSDDNSDDKSDDNLDDKSYDNSADKFLERFLGVDLEGSDMLTLSQFHIV